MTKVTAHEMNNLTTGVNTATPLYPKMVSKVSPAVGDSIEIKHEVKRTATGDVVGLQRRDRSANTEITVTYLDGTVATGRGDVWEVKLSGGRCKWETVNNFIKKDQE